MNGGILAKCLAMLAGFLMCAVPAAGHAGTQQPLDLPDGNGGNIEIQQPQEDWTDWDIATQNFVGPWVTNPTGCAWDPDDHWDLAATGDYLKPNTADTNTHCFIASTVQSYHCVYNIPGTGTVCGWWSGGTRSEQVFVAAPDNILTVTVCYSPQGNCFIPQPFYNANQRRYEWGFCSAVRYDHIDPALAVIPGSNGELFDPVRGLGLRTDFTVTVANNTSHTVRGITEWVQMVGTGGTGQVCEPGGHEPDQFAYPFSWYTS